MNIKDYPKSALEPIIDDWIINDLNCSRNRNIIKDKLFNGFTVEFISEKYELSVTQVKNIINDCRKIIVKQMLIYG